MKNQKSVIGSLLSLVMLIVALRRHACRTPKLLSSVAPLDRHEMKALAGFDEALQTQIEEELAHEGCQDGNSIEVACVGVAVRVNSPLGFLRRWLRDASGSHYTQTRNRVFEFRHGLFRNAGLHEV